MCRCPWRLEEGVGFPGVGLASGCKLPSVVLEAELGFPVRISALSLLTVMTKPSF